MKKLRVIEGFTYGEGDDANALEKGVIVEVDNATAAEWIKAKHAEVYDPDAEAKAAKKAEEAEAAEIERQSKVVRRVLDEYAQKGAEKRAITIQIGESELEKSGMGGFADTGHFLSEVIRASAQGARVPETLAKWQDLCVNKGLVQKIPQQGATPVRAPTHVMEEGDDTQGGYLVPVEIASVWMPPALENDISTSRAFKIPMRTNRLQMPALVDATHVGSYFGGVTIYRPGEKHQKTTSKPNLRAIQLTLHKMTVLVPISDELMEDSPISMAAFINGIVPQAIAFQRDWDHLAGTGANMALGAANAANPALIAVAAQPAQPITTIVFENIVNMWARFKMINAASSCWVAGRDCFPQLATMAMAVGAGGVPVYMPAGGVSGLPYATLMGLPLLLSEKTQLLGVQGDICLIDWSQYYYADKGGVKTAQSIHLWFDYDVTAFRFELRSDGQPAWNTPLTPANGGPTVSPFVVLAGRP